MQKGSGKDLEMDEQTFEDSVSSGSDGDEGYDKNDHTEQHTSN